MKPATTDDILDLLDSSFPSAATGAAMELGLFWLLESKPLGAGGVAAALKIPPGRCGYWLQLLTRAGLLEEGPGGYAPSATARAAILDAYSRETWALLAGQARERLPGLRDLSRHLRAPGSAWEALRLEPPMCYQQMAADPELAERFTRMLYELHGPLAERLARHLDLTGVGRLLDLGGGSGVISLALLRRHPGLRAVVVDIPNVCSAGRKIAAAQGLEDRIDYHAADFLVDELPSGFPVVLECDVDIYSPDLFRKVWRALEPGGRFVIVDQLAPAEGVAPPSRVHWALQRSMLEPQFHFLTAREIREQLADAGFQHVSSSPLPPVSDPCGRFSAEMTVLEVRK